MNTRENYLFFIQFDSELPEYYFQLAAHFSENQVSLVPVKAAELSTATSVGKYQVLGIVDCIANLKKMMDLRKSHLNMALTSEKITLYEFSSFRALPPNKKIRNTNYFHISLPVDIQSITKFVASMIKKAGAPEDAAWPGGKRGQIPGNEAR